MDTDWLVDTLVKRLRTTSAAENETALREGLEVLEAEGRQALYTRLIFGETVNWDGIFANRADDAGIDDVALWAINTAQSVAYARRIEELTATVAALRAELAEERAALAAELTIRAVDPPHVDFGDPPG